MNTKIKVMAMSLLCAFSVGAMAQADKQKEAKDYAPKVGDMAIGVNFNPVAAAQGGNPSSFSTVGHGVYFVQIPSKRTHGVQS